VQTVELWCHIAVAHTVKW